MILVTGKVTIADETAVTRLHDAMATQIAASRAEPGCLEYCYGVDVLDPKIIRVQERWRSWEDLEQHFKMSHMAPWREALADAGIVSRDLKAAEVIKERDL